MPYRIACLIFLICAALTLGFAVAADNAPAAIDEAPQQTASANTGPVMNGISYNDYADFQDKWKLVTVHYRSDTGELRFAYANPIAYASLMAGQIDYPDGAVFGKVTTMSEDDPAFLDSKIPADVLRYQLMVRDKVKYASTGGWGFAIFSARNLEAPPVHPRDDPATCYACHQIVKDRGYVFSFPAQLKVGEGMARLPASFPKIPLLTFSDYSLEKLPANIRALLPPGTEKVRFLVTPPAASDHLRFVGEFRPMLIQEAATSGLPALFFSETMGSFIIVNPLKQERLPTGLTCPPGQHGYETEGSENFTNIGRYFCN